ncbi:MAG: ParB/RepB/Spo0J family partition protein [Alphaproteobacteria bacterium]|nr:ParB/RepB/Spo0J family partition protein [Alphaproteobacteria bacterium]
MKVESRLGKGLSTFFENKQEKVPVFQNPNTDEKTEMGDVKYIPIGNIVPNKDQPRKTFKEEQLKELAVSIEKNGVLQPILVRKDKNNPVMFEIIAGERRWRAATFAGISEIPAIIKDLSDKETFEIGLIENLQRENLSPIEEASGYKKLMTLYGYTQEDISKIINKSRSYIANVLRLLSLPDEVQDMVNNGDLSYSIARTLVGKENPLKVAKSILKGDMTVKEAEDIVKPAKKLRIVTEEENSLTAELISLKENLSDTLNAKVDIKLRGKKGEIVIKFDDLSELNSITTKLNNI